MNDTHKGYLGLYTGPIEVGMWFIWEPNNEYAREVFEVTKVQDRGTDEKIIWSSDKTWNEESRFREAVVALPPQEVSVQEAARVLLEKWLEADFESGADADADDAFSAGKGSLEITETWLRALSGETT